MKGPLLASLILLLGLAQIASALEQSQAQLRTETPGQTKTLTGIVTDPSGAVVPGASIVLMRAENAAVESSTQSGPAGEYRLRATPGLYRVVATATGFARFESRIFGWETVRPADRVQQCWTSS